MAEETKENEKQLLLDLQQSNEVIDLFGSMQLVNKNTVVDKLVETELTKKGKLRANEMCFYRVKQLSFDEDYPHREAFENVLLSMDNDAFNFVYVLTGTEEGIELCLGVVQNQNENVSVLGKKLSASNYGEIISNVFEGNFSGSKLERLKGKELDKLVGDDLADKYKNAGVIVGIPSINEKEAGDDYDFQGIDRLINSMLGLEWRLVVVCEPVSKSEILNIKDDIYELYNRLSVVAKKTMQESINDGATITFGKNTSDSKGKNWGYNHGTSDSEGKNGEHWSKSTQYSEQNSEGHDESHSEGNNMGFNMNRGSSKSVTIEMANKHAEEIMKYINEELLDRMKVGYSKGLFKTSVYYMAKEPTHANRLKVGLMSLFQGNQSSYSPLYAQNIDVSKEFDVLRVYQNQYVREETASGDALMLLGRPFYGSNVGLNTYLTTAEISLLAGLPQKEVPGVSLKEGIGFGLNEKEIDDEESINLGNMVQKGRELTKIPFKLSKKSMSKHTFVAGVTGSGKTTTCHRLLSEADMPFLVIEPAKTEYRTLINTRKDIVVFTVGNETVAPLRLNPFELLEGEIISAHVDMIKATFTSAFPMEASMPQLLEEAIYRSYEKKGWDIDNNENTIYGAEAYDPEVDSFPILSDLLEEMKNVVEEKGFSQQMQADYIGSLVSRLSNLTVGSKGSMLNCAHSTDFEYIIKNNVIIEMEELKSPEDKALLMGFILSRLSAFVKAEHRKNHNFKHLTLVEEAHRLLSKVEYGDSGSKKSAVETFTDLLAEVRKYGEGLIIVDQIPNKLASEVLKNTNTKIIHKILAQDDKEAVGDTMLMDDKQKEYLSALEVGNAIVFSENTDKPVHVHITAVSDTNEEEIEDEVVRKRFYEKKAFLGTVYKDYDLLQLSGAFNKVCRKMAKLQDDPEMFMDMNKKFINTVGDDEEEQRKGWKKLIKRREAVTGKRIGSMEDEEERVQFLVDFFQNTFSANDFSVNMLNEEQARCVMKYCK